MANRSLIAGQRLEARRAGEIISAILLLIPRTTSLGILLTSAFWSGAICFHMTHGQPFTLPSVLLALSWIGAYLPEPLTLASFTRPLRSEGRPG